MFKKFVSLLLALLMIFTTFSVALVSASAADDTMTKLVALAKKFPEGKYWNHPVGTPNDPDSVTDTPCYCNRYGSCDWYGGCGCNSFNNSIQCLGYAEKASYDITGVNPDNYSVSYSLDVSKLRVGDIIRYNSHSVCVVGVSGDQIAITHANYDWQCGIFWDVFSKSKFSGLEYVQHLSGNERTNTNLYFYEDVFGGNEPDEPDEPEPPVVEPVTDAEIWQMDPDSGLNIRSSANTGAGAVGYIPAGEKFNAYEKIYDGEYLWAKVSYNGTTGYSVLNYAEYISGECETPELEGLKSSYSSSSGASLKWKAVSGAEKYTVSLFDKDKELIKSYTSTKNSYTIKNQGAGKYYVQITATNSLTPSWKIKGERKSFSIIEENVPVSKVSVRKTGLLVVGSEGTLTAAVEPANATNKEVNWTSSDTSVATVDSKGLVTAVKPGKVTIKCTSKENSSLSASCILTVKPETVSAVQVSEGTSASSVGLSWKKAGGATGYQVFRYNEEKKAYDKLAEGKGTKYTDKKLASGKVYTYVVRAYAETEDGRIDASYKEFKAKTVPSKITKIEQNGSDTGRVRFEWEKKANADAYDVYKYNSSTKQFEKLATTQTTSYIDKDKAAKKVYYRVVSLVKTSDGYVRSTSSPTLNAITGLEKPQITKTQSSGSAVKLTWSKVPYATHYQVFRVIDGKSVHIKTVTADKLSYTDKSLKSGTSYTYYVRAGRAHSDNLKLYSSKTSVKVKTA